MRWLYCLAGLFGIALSVGFVDKPLAVWIEQLQVAQQWPVLWWLTALGNSKMYLLALPVLAVLLHGLPKLQHWGSRVWFLWWCVLLPNLIAVLLKIACGRARPTLWFSEQVHGFFGPQFNELYWSFPSGHTTTIMGFALGLVVLFPRFAWFYLSLACLVVLSRILLLQHYLGDVLMATWLCSLEVWLITQIWHYYQRDKIRHG